MVTLWVKYSFKVVPSLPNLKSKSSFTPLIISISLYYMLRLNKFELNQITTQQIIT